jgi:uncharacterized protein (DUF983 family)
VLRKRCPQCGEGRLFASFARLEPACAVCGLVYRRESGAMTGSMYLSAAITQIFGALVIAAVWLGTDWGALRSIAVGVPIVLIFSVLFQPYSMAIWVWVEYLTDIGNREKWVRPPR